MNRRSRSGFTLIELLVVIAVIGILAAILFPIFSRAKGMAQRVKCASNMRQLGVAFGMYCSEWDGLYPSPGGLTGERNYWSQSGWGGLTRYAGNRAGGFNTIWCCPYLKHWGSPFPVRSYSMNSYLRTPSDVAYPTGIRIKEPIRQDAVPSPKSTILLYEGALVIKPTPSTVPEYQTAGIYVYRCGDWTCVKGWYNGPAPSFPDGETPWHEDVNNYLYCDGHVKARPPGKHSSTYPQVSWDEAREWYVDKGKYRYLWPP
ncbi:MAG: type II secretion system protein [Armatimonadota bacterium]|nr:type II secretion system protein [Armatimonadota bacterium]